MTSEFDTPGYRFLAMADAVPDQLSFVTDDGMLNYSQLGSIVRAVTARMCDLGVGPGDLVAVASDDVVPAFAALLATSLLGGRWIAAGNAAFLPKGMEPKVILASRPGQAGALVMDASWFTGARWSPDTTPDTTVGTDAADTANAAPTATPTNTLPSSWLLLSTSGTTGQPKLMGLSQRAMARRAQALRPDFITRETVFCGLAQCSAPPYLTFVLASLLNGCTVVRSRNPLVWIQAGVTLLHGSVAQVSGLLQGVRLPKKLPQVAVGGSGMPDALATRLLDNFEVVTEYYAATETNRSYKHLKTMGPDGAIQTTGLPQDSEIQIVDPEGRSVPEGQSGEVRIRNDYLAEGYLDRPEAQAKAFRDGWFYPGDIGYWGENGHLRILGRYSDVLNVEGTKINAAEIDAVLRSVAGISEAVSFVYNTAQGASELVAFAIFADRVDAETVGQAALLECAQRLGRVRTPARLVPINTLPRAKDGGAQRFACATLYESLKAAQQ